MDFLTNQARQKIDELANRYHVSPDAVLVLLQGLVAGNGTMAQFSHPELGGHGQWMAGGLTMVGDPFNHALKAKVEGLCSELAALLGQQPFLPSPAPGPAPSPSSSGNRGSSPVSVSVPATAGAFGDWWPSELGTPDAVGGQNQVRYAYFAGARRLAVDVSGRRTVYDTRGHRISGIAQQQGEDATLTFTGPDGAVRLADLPVVFAAGHSGGGEVPGQKGGDR